MKYANIINAEYLIVIGEDEVKNKKCKIKNMKSGEEVKIKLDSDNILNVIFEFEEEIGM